MKNLSCNSVIVDGVFCGPEIPDGAFGGPEIEEGTFHVYLDFIGKEFLHSNKKKKCPCPPVELPRDDASKVSGKDEKKNSGNEKN